MSLGYSVLCSDVAPEFVDRLQNDGLDAINLDVLSGQIPGEFDLIIADAVLLHFSKGETIDVIGKLARSLISGGKLAIALKRGEGSYWTSAKFGEPRFFCLWNETELEEVLLREGLDVADIQVDLSQQESDWLLAIATKQ